MEGRRPSPAALLLLALVLAAGSLAAMAQLHPPAGTRYVLVTLQSGRGEDARFALRTGGDVFIPAGFANGKRRFAVPHGNSNRRVDIPGQGLVDLLGALVNNGAR
ncbi:unnamed protein product [Urochloa decumbens]|uniref:Uncharacterized protein n=1 Tax=Urochloa decumbens TaxID=240449 RepID=A0ABC9DC96_9POAL